MPIPKKTANRAALGELERVVMDVLWSLDDDADATVREVHSTLVAADRDVAYTTVMTVMQRLASKGTLVEQKAGRAYRYRPRASRAEMTADLLRGTLESLGEREREPALVAFVEEASPSDLAALRRALAALEG